MRNWSLRTRAAVLWGVGFVVLGVALLVILATLIRARIGESPDDVTSLIVEELGFEIESVGELTVTDPSGHAVTGDEIDPLLREVAGETRQDIARWTLIALPLLAVVGAFAGWWLAGHALEPVAAMTAKARRVSSDRLDTRIGLAGPRDELKELGDAFDSMMERLEHAFEAQGRFAASASHELRTPLTLIRTELDVALDQPNPSPEELREMADAIREAITRSERVIDSLLMLARSGIVEAVTAIDLGAMADTILYEMSREIESMGIAVTKQLSRSFVKGDEILVERLVRNLIANGIVHNLPGGRLEVGVSTTNGEVQMWLANTGIEVDSDTLDRLTEPFYRGEGGTRVPGSGLGLTIAASIADAHGAELRLASRPGGGMTAKLSFPAAQGSSIGETQLPTKRSPTRG
jgi:signal transduction histidine kinase